MNLVIDIGNTRTKVYLFKKDLLFLERSVERLTVPYLKKIFQKYRPSASILSSVIHTPINLSKYLKSQGVFIQLNADTPLPLKNKYQTPKTLGNDRLANAAGALKLFPGKSCLVIDIGTCIKYDFITSKKEYLGGAISPGMLMRYQSLHDYTAKLPLEKPALEPVVIGKSTKESINSGVQQGMLNEMEGFISQYRKKYKNLKVIVTGGDARCFDHLFNLRIFAAPQLTATGLNEILQHNTANS